MVRIGMRVAGIFAFLVVVACPTVDAATPTASDAALIAIAVKGATATQITVEAIFQEGSYALAEWRGTHVPEAGEALLHRSSSEKWWVLLYGGGAFSAGDLERRGVPQATAKTLMGDVASASLK